MNILIVTPFFVPDPSGIAYHVYNISVHLIRRGHKVIIITPSRRYFHEQFKNLTIYRVKTFNLPSCLSYSLASFSIPYQPLKLWTLMKELIVDGVDVVHIHDQHYFTSWIAGILAHKFNVPLVLTLHGIYGFDPLYPIGRSLDRIFDQSVFRWLLRKTNIVIGLTNILIEHAKRCGGERCEYFNIPNGVDVRRFRSYLQLKQKFRKKYGLPLDMIIILFVGRFSYAKGVLNLAEAAKIISSKDKNVFFMFLGSGPLQKELERVSNSISSIKIFGWIPNSKIHEFYIASDIFVLPSKREALPLTIMEAIASHLHIVVTPVGGIPEILADYAWKTYIKGFSLSDITEALERALWIVDEEKVEGLEADITRFDWSRISEKIENVYTRARALLEPKVYFND